jgi:hypothetical protein
MIASISCSCPAGPRTIRWMIAWRSSLTTPVIMLLVIVDRNRSDARSGSQFASTISGRSEPESRGGPRQLIHLRLPRRLRFRYRWQRIFPHSRFPEWGEAQLHRSYPHGGRTLLSVTRLVFHCDTRPDLRFRNLTQIYISRCNLAITLTRRLSSHGRRALRAGPKSCLKPDV